MKDATDFLLTLGHYYFARLSDAWGRIVSGINPWNAKTFAGGVASLAYLLCVVIFCAYLIYSGFARHSKINFTYLAVLCVLFVLSCLK